MHVCVCTYLCVCVYVCVCVWVWVCACVCMYIYVYMYLYIYIYMYIYMYTYIYILIYIHVFVIYIYIYLFSYVRNCDRPILSKSSHGFLAGPLCLLQHGLIAWGLWLRVFRGVAFRTWGSKFGRVHARWAPNWGLGMYCVQATKVFCKSIIGSHNCNFDTRACLSGYLPGRFPTRSSCNASAFQDTRIRNQTAIGSGLREALTFDGQP